jgi:hypothetical protein
MNWKEFGRKNFGLNKVLPQNLVSGTEENREDPQDSWCLSRDSNQANPEYNSNRVTATPTCSQTCILYNFNLRYVLIIMSRD